MSTGLSIHIGLNSVDANAYGGWDGALSGCINDARSMRDIAVAQGFTPTMLLDSQATSAAVIAAIGRAGTQLVAGDILLVSYSGHGGQVPDVNGDEPDGQDETWVLYDRQLVDDELYQLWSQFRSGVRVLVISDSCHSGSVARMIASVKVREAVHVVEAREPEAALTQVVQEMARRATGDGDPSYGNVGQPELRPRAMPPDMALRNARANQTTYETMQFLSGITRDADIRPSILLVAGCQDYQLSYDGSVNGRFTQELLAVWNSGGFQGDYVDFHRRICDRMPPDQLPNLFHTGTPNSAFDAQRPFTVAAPAGTTVSGPSSTGTGQARPDLRRGDEGAAVEELQRLLNSHGQTVVLDGWFGSGTQAAVIAFQREQGLPADGIVGAQTWAALLQTPTGSTSSTTPSTSAGDRPVLREGDEGDDVTHLQERLVEWGYWLSVDGIFGSYTASLVRSFQRDHGLTADGIVGASTWEALEQSPAVV